jgi:hypothetical protein
MSLVCGNRSTARTRKCCGESSIRGCWLLDTANESACGNQVIPGAVFTAHA